MSTDLVAIPATSATPYAASVTPTGLTPAQVRQAYGVSNITFANGSIVGDGTGQTIAIVVAYDNPYIISDLQTFDRQYGLPDPSIQVIKQTSSMKVNGGWAIEASLDVQWAHAIAPGANILVVEAKSDALSDLMTMVNVARQQPGVSVVSMSWGMNEFANERSYNSSFTTPIGHQGVTFVAASGDDGSWLGASFPAISPNVLGVGGTQLYVSPSGIYQGETAWSGSGGGYSKFQAEPAYQRSAQNSGLRTSPDVSWNASVASGVSVYSSISDVGSGGWFSVGGTSAGTPAWAGLIAIADQGRALNGVGSLAGAQSVVYSLPSSAFHDITTGRNGYSAGAGYDVVTGLGSPYADRVVAGLVDAPGQGVGNYAAAASPRRVRRLHRLRAKQNSDFESNLTTQLASSIIVSAGTIASGTSGSIQITIVNPNQSFVVQVVTNNGRILEELVVPVPALDIASISVNQPIAPITEVLLHSVSGEPNVERVGQGDDPQLPSADQSKGISDPKAPSISDFLDRQASKIDPGSQVPVNLAPQDPPVVPNRNLDPQPPVPNNQINEIITRWERSLDFEWTPEDLPVEDFVGLRQDDTRNAEDEQEEQDSAGTVGLTAAVAFIFGGSRLFPSRLGRRNFDFGVGSTLSGRKERTFSPSGDSFRHILQRKHRNRGEG